MWHLLDTGLMGFLGKLFNAITQSAPIETRTISFDSDWADSWETLRMEYERNPRPVETSVSFSDELLTEIWTAIERHSASPRIPYVDDKTPINNVGESYRQEEISAFCKGLPGEDMPWLAGFLIPEMSNPYDKTAVAIYVIKQISSEIAVTAPEQADATGRDEELSPYEILHGGYMDKESAKKVHKKILNLIGKDQYVPLLIRMTGGTTDKPNYGVFAYAMTNKIKFA